MALSLDFSRPIYKRKPVITQEDIDALRGEVASLEPIDLEPLAPPPLTPEEEAGAQIDFEAQPPVGVDLEERPYTAYRGEPIVGLPDIGGAVGGAARRVPSALREIIESLGRVTAPEGAPSPEGRGYTAYRGEPIVGLPDVGSLGPVTAPEGAPSPEGRGYTAYRGTPIVGLPDLALGGITAPEGAPSPEGRGYTAYRGEPIVGLPDIGGALGSAGEAIGSLGRVTAPEGAPSPEGQGYTGFGAEPLTVGEAAANLVLPPLQAIEQGVTDPLVGSLAAGADAFNPFNVAEYGKPLPGQVLKDIGAKAAERNPQTVGDWVAALHNAAADYERERPEAFPGEKFLTHAIFDILNLIGIGLEPKIAAAVSRAGKALVRTGKEAVEEAAPAVGALTRQAGDVLASERGSAGLPDWMIQRAKRIEATPEEYRADRIASAQSGMASAAAGRLWADQTDYLIALKREEVLALASRMADDPNYTGSANSAIEWLREHLPRAEGTQLTVFQAAEDEVQRSARAAGAGKAAEALPDTQMVASEARPQAKTPAETIADALPDKPNAARGETALKKTDAAGFDTTDARTALDDYRGIERADYDDIESYRSDRQDAWQAFKDTLSQSETKGLETSASPPGTVQAATSPDIISTPSQPKQYIMREEPEPLLPGGKKYVLYAPDGTPRNLGAATPEELAARLRQNEPDATIIPETPAGAAATEFATQTERDAARAEFQQRWAAQYGDRPDTAPSSTARSEAEAARADEPPTPPIEPPRPPVPPEPPAGAVGIASTAPPVAPVVGSPAPGGGIVGAQPPPAPVAPTPAGVVVPKPSPREFWARPLANLDMVTGAFKDNFWRSAAQRTGLKQFTTVINPAALVSGTATDPLSITKRALLLRNRLLDVGDSAVNAGMAFLRERSNPFSIGGEGRITSLPGKPLWYDVFDNPTAYKLTADQQDYVQLYRDMVDDALTLAKQNGIDVKELQFAGDRHYIPRLVEAIRGIENEKAGRVGGRVGAKAGFQKTRFYEWAEDGVGRGVVYSNDPLTVMEHHIGSTYRLVADKRLADELKPLGETILERVEQKRPGLLAAREAAKKEFARARELLGAVNRAYRGERLPPALVLSIGRSFPAEAAALKAAGPNSPALQPIEAAARALMAQHRGKWDNISAQLGRVKDMVEPGFDEARLPQPFAQGRIFPKDVAKSVDAAVGDQGAAWLRAAQVPSAISRTLGTTIDFGAPFIQGLAVIGENPGAWARATLKHYQAFLDPGAKQRFFTQHADSVKEMAQYGANVGGSEFFAGNRPLTSAFKFLPEERRQVVTWMGKQTVGRFQEAFGTFLDASAVYMWEALRGRALREGSDSLFALGDYVSHARGTMSYRTTGIGLGQQQIEGGLMMFAPRYTRAGAALLSDVVTLPGFLKENAFRANLSAIVGSALLYFMGGAAALNALGLMKPEDVQERLNPIKNGRYNSKFLTLPIGTDNVGLGGFGYSMLRLIAGGTDKALNQPEDLLKWDAQDNPIMGLFRSRLVGGAPAASLAIELFTGRNYFGEKLDKPLDYAAAVAERLMPFWAEAYIGHVPAFREQDIFQQPPASLEALPFAFAGQRVFPQSYGARAAKMEEELAQGRGWSLPLSRDQRRQLAADHPELAELKELAERQSEKFAKDETQQQTADYFADLEKSKGLRERALEAPYRGFLNGKLSGKELLKIRSDANEEMAGAAGLAQEKYPLALTDRAKRDVYYAKKRIEIKEGHPDDIAAEGYYNIRLPVGEEGKDWDAFFQAREEYLKQFTPEVQHYITKVYPNKRFEQEWMNELEAEIQKDLETLKPYWDTGKLLQSQKTAYAKAVEQRNAFQDKSPEQKEFERTNLFWRKYKQELEADHDRLKGVPAGRPTEIFKAGAKWGYWGPELKKVGPQPPKPPVAPLPPLAPVRPVSPAAKPVSPAVESLRQYLRAGQ